MAKCPGQDQRYWQPDDIFEMKCPSCGVTMEFWKDDARLKCSKCGEIARNPRIDLGCAKWCQYASHCLGVLPDENDQVICDTLIDEMKAICGESQKRIDHALEVLSHTNDIQSAQDGNPLVVKAAALFLDIVKRSSTDGPEPGVAMISFDQLRVIVDKAITQQDITPEAIDQICEIIENHHRGECGDSIESKIVWDAHCLTMFQEKNAEVKKEELEEIISKTFKTKNGRQIATELFVS